MSARMSRGGREGTGSTTRMISRWSGGMVRLRRKAGAGPASNPLITINIASSMVTTTPDRMSGRYFSITLPLKKVSTKRSQALMESSPHPEERAQRASRRMATAGLVPPFETAASRPPQGEVWCVSIPPLVPLDLADEGAGAFLGRLLENRGRWPLLDDHPVVHEDHPI